MDNKDILDGDHFTWWFDEMMNDEDLNANRKKSVYEVAWLAWEEALKRAGVSHG